MEPKSASDTEPSRWVGLWHVLRSKDFGTTLGILSYWSSIVFRRNDEDQIERFRRE